MLENVIEVYSLNGTLLKFIKFCTKEHQIVCELIVLFMLLKIDADDLIKGANEIKEKECNFKDAIKS